MGLTATVTPDDSVNCERPSGRLDGGHRATDPARPPRRRTRLQYGEKAGGWRAWTDAPFNFRNQGDCVSYVQLRA